MTLLSIVHGGEEQGYTHDATDILIQTTQELGSELLLLEWTITWYNDSWEFENYNGPGAGLDTRLERWIASVPSTDGG
jgi:hypothetical protein